jgi:hypothetical protein
MIIKHASGAIASGHRAGKADTQLLQVPIKLKRRKQKVSGGNFCTAQPDRLTDRLQLQRKLYQLHAGPVEERPNARRVSLPPRDGASRTRNSSSAPTIVRTGSSSSGASLP